MHGGNVSLLGAASRHTHISVTTAQSYHELLSCIETRLLGLRTPWLVFLRKRISRALGGNGRHLLTQQLNMGGAWHCQSHVIDLHSQFIGELLQKYGQSAVLCSLVLQHSTHSRLVVSQPWLEADGSIQHA